jgi:ribonuclease BN (tRNA processing enzyme)
VYCSDQVRQVVSNYLLAPCYWIDFFAGPDPNRPVFEQQKVEPGRQFSIGPYCVLPVPVNHSVPTIGFQIADSNGRRLYYTGDNGPGCGQFWTATQPDTIITECTYPNAQAAVAERHGHLAPIHLEQALEVFRAARGYVPRVILVHVNPLQEEVIRVEVAEVARRLQADIVIGTEGMTVTV